MTFREWFTLIWRLSEYLSHQWALVFDPDKDLGEDWQNIEELVARIDKVTRERSAPGPLGWGITAPNVYQNIGGLIIWDHITGSGRLALHGEFMSESRWTIEVQVRRPYPWQPWCLRLVWSQTPFWADPAPEARIEAFGPYGERHVGVLKDVVQALGLNDALAEQVEALSPLGQRDLAIEDAAALLQYYLLEEGEEYRPIFEQ